MSTEMTVASAEEFLRARRAYEIGRARSSMWRALIIALPIALAAWLLTGQSALLGLPLTLCAWMFAYWRGDVFLRGAFYGLAGGVVTFLLPMSLLRPCCAPGAMPNMGTSCCTMPSVCLAAGAIVGVMLAIAVPYDKDKALRAALGMMLGVASMAIMKCATLFAGEAVGLLGGLLAGALAASLAKSMLRARSE